MGLGDDFCIPLHSLQAYELFFCSVCICIWYFSRVRATVMALRHQAGWVGMVGPGLRFCDIHMTQKALNSVLLLHLNLYNTSLSLSNFMHLATRTGQWFLIE